MKDYRPLVFVCLSLIALFIFVYPLIVKTEGVIVTFVGTNSACKDVISVDSYITEITGMPVKNMNDFNRITKNLKGPITLIIDDNPRSCTIPENSSLDVKVRNVRIGGIKTSIEIGGGSYFVFKPEKEVSQNALQNILSTIKSRAKSYNLINTIIRIENESILIISGSQEDNYAELLTEKGLLYGKITEIIDFTNKRSEFTLNKSLYEVVLKGNNSIAINGSVYKIDQNFILNGLSFKVENISDNTTILSIQIFNDKDLILQEDTTSSSRIMKQGNGYVLVVPVILSNNASENFARATVNKEITIDPSTGEGYLKSPLLIFIDEKQFTNLPIRAVDAGKTTGQLILWKYTQSEKEASNDLIRLKSIIEFKSLPTDLRLIETGDYKSSSGKFYFSLLLYGVLISAAIFSIFFLVRYKKRGIIIGTLLAVILAEIVFAIGVIVIPWFGLFLFFICIILAVLNGEVDNWISWTTIFLMFVLSVGIAMTNLILDEYSIIGMLVVVLFSLAMGSIIGDKILLKKDVHFIGEYKKSLKFVWWASFITTIFLLALFFSINELRVFSAVIFVGVLSFATLTRPIYFNLIEKTTKKF